MIQSALYHQLQSKIKKINFSLLWPGFHPFDFALFDEESVMLKGEILPKTHEFLGNTAIHYQGRLLATWKVDTDSPEDLDVFASLLVHEMFHCFQMEQLESRYPNDLSLLRYPDNLDNYEWKAYENRLLLQAYEEKNEALFQEFVQTREHRTTLIGEIIHQEAKAETIEGSAEYVGLLALKQCSLRQYDERVQDFARKLLDPANLFDIRRMSYVTGVFLLLNLQEHQIDVDKNLQHPHPFFDQLTVQETNLKLVKISGFLKAHFDAYLQKKRDTFVKYRALLTNRHPGNFIICGYDPMNMIRIGDDILATHLIFLESQGEIIKLLEPVILKCQANSDNVIEAYYTR